ncbi:MAG: hypothetical protein SF028_10900 [Candidatus Sumerlaeia bacterium]|nr:hypothetical protein [Candidatus Sumerlaeia bacterium]
MHFIYFQQSGKAIDGNSGHFWSLGGLSVPGSKWKTLQARINGLHRSFQRKNYRPAMTRMDANDLLHPRNAERPWSLAYCKSLERVVAGLGIKFFLVVVDKRTTDKPAHPSWLVPLAYQYLSRPIAQHLREQSSLGCIVIPEGRPDEQRVLTELQFVHTVSAIAKTSPLVATPMMQKEVESAGLQVADFIATVARRYHESVYPKLFQKQVLEGYDAIINSHYQGFIKPNTFQSVHSDPRGYRFRGYIYLWRRDAQGESGHVEGESSQGRGGGNPSADQFDEERGGSGAQASSLVAETRPPYGGGDSQ